VIGTKVPAVFCGRTVFLAESFLGSTQGLLPSEKKTRILFMLDALGSMLAPWEQSTKIEAAKIILSDLIDSLKVSPNLELALRVYRSSISSPGTELQGHIPRSSIRSWKS